MEKSKFPKIVLCISGLIAPRKADLEEITVGVMIQISPVDFYATNNRPLAKYEFQSFN